jgi:hypothetical protein
MRVVLHPLVDQDLVALVDHIVDVTDVAYVAAGRRLDEVKELFAAISANPLSGVRLGPPLDGWMVRHGGRGHWLTLVFRADLAQDCLFVALAAFGGQDWMMESATRKSFGG